MARRKEEKKGQPVNRVRRKADENDITLGSSSSLPEDDKKSIRKKGDKLELPSTKKRVASEPDEAKKGRAPKKEKPVASGEPKKRAPRKSELEKQYTKELRNLRNRLKYREKQGFFVKWETLPARKTGAISQFDIDVLKNYSPQLNPQTNEIYLERTLYKGEARKDKLRVPTDLLPSSTYVDNESDFTPPVNEWGEFDVLDLIEARLSGALERYYYELDNADEAYNVDYYVELMYSKISVIQDAIKIFDRQMANYPHVMLARYYHNHEQEIATCISQLNEARYTDEIAEIGNQLVRYIEVH